MDWGLAKLRGDGMSGNSGASRLGEADLAEQVSRLRSECGSGATLDGALFGTPAYMSPEQA